MLDEKFIAKQKKIIEKNVERLEKEVTQNKKFEEIGGSPDDTTQEFEAFEEKQALLRSAQRDMKDLKASLKRIDEGKYGVCSVCGEPIEKGRLEAYPAATTCVTHAGKK
jgi:RNA polymerase-binding transcription factor DksA